MAESNGTRQMNSGKYRKSGGTLVRKKSVPYSNTYRGK